MSQAEEPEDGAMKAAGAGPVRCPPLTLTDRGTAAPALQVQPQSQSSALLALQRPPPALAMPPSCDRHVRQKVFQAPIPDITEFCCIADHSWPACIEAVTHLGICKQSTSHLFPRRYFQATAWRSSTLSSGIPSNTKSRRSFARGVAKSGCLRVSYCHRSHSPLQVGGDSVSVSPVASPARQLVAAPMLMGAAPERGRVTGSKTPNKTHSPPGSRGVSPVRVNLVHHLIRSA